MKPSEKVVLDTLRKTTLAYLSESDYAQIEKAVEQKGILNLTGTASILVKSAVQKHEGGGHDQASHGSWSDSPHNYDNPRAMDNMDTGRKLDKPTASQRKLVARITSPASSTYINRPFGGVQFASTWRRADNEPQIIGYKTETKK